MTRLDEVKIDESATTEKIKIKKFNFYSQSGNSICIPQKDYDLIKENIEKFFVATDEDEVSYILYSKWKANLFLYAVNYTFFYSTYGVIPLYGAIDGTTKIIITNKNYESRIYQSKFSDEALAGLLVLPFIAGRNLSEVREAKVRKSIHNASLVKPVVENFVPISDDFKLKICEEKEINEKK